MSDKTGIEWTDSTWNVLVGCDKVSPGCDHCYAIRTAHRMTAHPNPKVSEAYAGTEANGEWTGQVNLLAQRLDQPLRWANPRRVFVNAQSDLFHADVPDEFIARVWAVMGLAERHTFQILTKRPVRMRSLLSSPAFGVRVLDAAYLMAVGEDPDVTVPKALAAGCRDRVTVTRALMDVPEVDAGSLLPWPLPNVWLGTSVEDQKRANLRVWPLLDTPAAVRFISAEPLLGPVDLRRTSPTRIGGALYRDALSPLTDADTGAVLSPGLDWVITGGESGPGSRPMHPAWVRSLRDQCEATGVAFLHKQWGNFSPYVPTSPHPFDPDRTVPDWGHPHVFVSYADGTVVTTAADVPGTGDWQTMYPMHKSRAGRRLDGQTYDGYPEARS